LLKQLEEQTEIIKRLEKEISGVRKLLELSGVGDYASTDEFINVNILCLFYI
jgi:hypothetical protein